MSHQDISDARLLRGIAFLNAGAGELVGLALFLGLAHLQLFEADIELGHGLAQFGQLVFDHRVGGERRAPASFMADSRQQFHVVLMHKTDRSWGHGLVQLENQRDETAAFADLRHVDFADHAVLGQAVDDLLDLANHHVAADPPLLAARNVLVLRQKAVAGHLTRRDHIETKGYPVRAARQIRNKELHSTSISELALTDRAYRPV